MAIFGTLTDLTPLFSKTQELEALLVGLQNALNPQHPLHQKIQTLEENQSFEEHLPFEMRLIAHCYRLKSEPFFESHRNYYDFQMPIEGFEAYWLGNQNQFSLLKDHDTQKDLMIWESKTTLPNKIWLHPAEVAVLAPYDIHAVGIGEGETLGKLVRKIICKVPIAYIKHRL